MGNESSKSGKSHSSGITASLGLKSGPSNAVVQRHIDTAKKSRVLQLRDSHLKKIPDVVFELSDVLRSIDLTTNRIPTLPSQIGNFSLLKQLHLSENAIEIIPDEIGCLKNLEVLNLHKNKLRELPLSMSACTSLRTLTISSNMFEVFPIVLCALIELETVNLSGNKLEGLPEEISTCRASELNLNQNRLTSLQTDSLKQCPRLRTLRVEENCLAQTEFTEDFLTNGTVAIIAYSGNLFQDKDFQALPGYESYQERYTATKRKM